MSRLLTVHNDLWRFEAADAVEAATLADRVGQTFAAVVVDTPDADDKGGHLDVQLVDPPVLSTAKGSADLGAEVTVRLESADLAERRVVFRR